MIMYNMKFVAVDTYDIVNVGLRSQMVWKGLIDKVIGEEAALKCFTACEQLAVECAIFHFLIEWIKEQSNANFYCSNEFHEACRLQHDEVFDTLSSNYH